MRYRIGLPTCWPYLLDVGNFALINRRLSSPKIPLAPVDGAPVNDPRFYRIDYRSIRAETLHGTIALEIESNHVRYRLQVSLEEGSQRFSDVHFGSWEKAEHQTFHLMRPSEILSITLYSQSDPRCWYVNETPQFLP